MAQPWKQTLEPYIKVSESVRKSTLSTTAGEDLIVGAVLISDSGPGTPTLITSQQEFLANYASTDLTEEYVKSLNNLYTSDPNSNLAAQMWLNAFRLAGSTNLLICRASKSSDIVYAKSISNDGSSFILKDGEVLKKYEGSIELKVGTATNNSFAISIDEVGVIGNYVSDAGNQYDYYAGNVYELVGRLNETAKFHCPDFTCKNVDGDVISVTSEADQLLVDSIVLNEVYLAANLLDEDFLVPNTSTYGYYQISGADKLNMDYTPVSYYATNPYNTNTELKIRIRRYNHNAVSTRALTPTEEQAGTSPYATLAAVLGNLYSTVKDGNVAAIEAYDFYEFAITDPGLSEYPVMFYVGNIPGRGDITINELNSSLKMMQLVLPDDLKKLELNYHDYAANYVGYKEGWANEINVNLSIDPSQTTLLNVSDSDIMAAFDKLEDDERYVVEGLTDLGCTYTNIQNYIANIAMNSNYFYPVSTADSTNYMTIASKSTKITADTPKVYMLSPWDYDDGTVGFMYHASPSILYWETVSKNRRNNHEFRGAFGPEGGVCSIVNLAKEFTKTERQLLLTKKVNTIFHDLYLDSLYINDNKTKQSIDNVLSEENNVRLQIRISKAMPLILKQFIGRQNNSKTALEAESIINSWFRTTIVPMQYKCSDWKVQVADVTDFSTNTMTVKIQVKFFNSIKYIEVYNEALPLDLEFE
jgi:hypothetical protein